MQYSKSTGYIFAFVDKAKEKRLTKSLSGSVQKIPVDEQTRNDFELTHNTKLKDPIIYLEPDDGIFRMNAILAYAIANEIHIKKSNMNWLIYNSIRKIGITNPLMNLNLKQILMKFTICETEKKCTG